MKSNFPCESGISTGSSGASGGAATRRVVPTRQNVKASARENAMENPNARVEFGFGSDCFMECDVEFCWRERNVFANNTAIRFYMQHQSHALLARSKASHSFS